MSKHAAHECRVVRHIDSLQAYATARPAVLPDSTSVAARAFASRYAEAVCRMALLPLHQPEVGRQIMELSSSYPSDGTPFGEHAETMNIALNQLQALLPSTIGSKTTCARAMRPPTSEPQSRKALTSPVIESLPDGLKERELAVVALRSLAHEYGRSGCARKGE